MDSLSRPQARILLVDDDPLILRVLQTHLKAFGEITTASCGEEALLKIAKEMPDLVILDVDMPGMDGYATCRAVKGNPETTDLPVVFITTFDDVESETRALNMGGADFIRKPVNPAVLQARVKTQLALRHKTEELRRLNNLDGLTQISNRRAFDEVLVLEWRRALRNQSPLSLLMVDIDHFKQFNDTYGHLIGDDCLRQVAQALHHCLKRAGDFVARYGGEEFAAILANTGSGDAQDLAEQLCQQVRKLAIPHGSSPTASVVTLSVGLASYCPKQYEGICASARELAYPAEPSILLRGADQALYLAKQQGRNRVVHGE
ncbi:MAG: diguanylate cyclase [Thiobacillus sp.]|nr:diguanylate cyclase [Thiobacillus sp.]